MASRDESHNGPTWTLTRRQSRALDYAAASELAIPGLVLMENAAAALEAACRSLRNLGDDLVLVLCGPGNNGGDGLALVRRLICAGHTPVIAALTAPRRAYRGDAGAQLDIVQRLAEHGPPGARPVIVDLDDARAVPQLLAELVEREAPDSIGPGGVAADVVVVDALFGTGLTRPIEGVPAAAVRFAAMLRANGARVLAVDVPSGLDADTGQPVGGGPAVEADLTVTMAALKPGLLTAEGRRRAGRIEVGDIGVPAWLIERMAASGDDPRPGQSPGGPAGR